MTGTGRSELYAADYEVAQDGFIRLVESLSDGDWTRAGANYPRRVGDEDEGRPIAVIAHHVAESGPWIIDRIQAMVGGRPLPPVDYREINARHARERAAVTRDEVLTLLRESKTTIAAAVRAIPDAALDEARDTPAGPMSVAQRLELVLIGHIKTHEGSIRAALA